MSKCGPKAFWVGMKALVIDYAQYLYGQWQYENEEAFFVPFCVLWFIVWFLPCWSLVQFIDPSHPLPFIAMLLMTILFTIILMLIFAVLCMGIIVPITWKVFNFIKNACARGQDILKGERDD